MARDKVLSILMLAPFLMMPFALAQDFSTQACSDIDPNNYFKSINAKAGNGQGGTLRGKSVRYTLTLVPNQVQPSPALQSSLDLRIDVSEFLDVTTARMKRPSGSSAIVPVIDRNADTVTFNNIGNALLGVGSKKRVPQKLTFTITATLASNTPGAGTKIEAYLIDDDEVRAKAVTVTNEMIKGTDLEQASLMEIVNVCLVKVSEAKVKVREPTGAKDVKGK